MSIGTTVAGVSGDWSLADANLLADGTYQFTARATDAAGNQGAASTAFQVTIDTTAPGAPTFGSVTDNVAPVTGPVADNGTTNDTTLTIDGTAELGSTVTVYDTDGTTVVGTGVATGGAGPITTSALSEGAHTLTLKATDAAGNQSAASTAFHVTIDTLAPVAPVIGSVTDDVEPVTGAVADNGSSNDNTLTIAGTAAAGSTVTLYDTDGTTVLGTGVATGGAFSITTSVLDEGAHALTAKASDAAGNQSAASAAFQVTIDTTAPAALVITHDRGRRRPDQRRRSGGRGHGFGYGGDRLDADGERRGGDGRRQRRLEHLGGDGGPGPADGDGGGHGRGRQLCDGDAQSDGRHARRQRWSITTIEGGDDLINAAEAAGGVTVSGTAEIGSTLTVNGAAVTVDGSGAWSTSVATAGEGLLTVTAVATDAAGNSATATHDLTVDTLGAGVAITAIGRGRRRPDQTPRDAARRRARRHGRDHADDADGRTAAAVTVDGTRRTGAPAGGDGRGETAVLTSARRVATDAAGNQSAASTAFHVTIDTTAPVAEVADHGDCHRQRHVVERLRHQRHDADGLGHARAARPRREGAGQQRRRRQLGRCHHQHGEHLELHRSRRRTPRASPTRRGSSTARAMSAPTPPARR